jgi:hypothetical protein
MNSLSYNPDLTAALFSVAMVVAVLSFTAVAFFVWRGRPVKKDEYQRIKVHDRLTALANAKPQSRKSA